MLLKKPTDVLAFSRKYRRIIIYGAGVYGRVVCCYLSENNIDIAAFAVTNPTYKKVLNHEVLDIIEADLCDGTGVVVCANDCISSEMINVLDELKFKDYICVNKDIIDEMDGINTYDSVYHEKGEKHILLYHRVAEIVPDVWNIAVRPTDFRRHLEFLKQNYKLLSYDEAIYERDEAVAITFDDGYADFYSEAFPIIQELQVPVTVFVATGRIGKSKSFWWDEIENMIWNNPDCPHKISFERASISLNTEVEKRLGIEHIRQLLIKYDSGMINSKLDVLAKKLKTTRRDDEQYRCMTEEELIEIDNSPWVSIGGHTVTHTRLTSEDKETQLWEMRESKHSLERILGHEVTSFSFPFGCETDYDEVSIQVALEAGYKTIAAVRNKYYSEDQYKYNPSRITIGVEKNYSPSNSGNRDIRRNLYLGTWII